MSKLRLIIVSGVAVSAICGLMIYRACGNVTKHSASSPGTTLMRSFSTAVSGGDDCKCCETWNEEQQGCVSNPALRCCASGACVDAKGWCKCGDGNEPGRCAECTEVCVNGECRPTNMAKCPDGRCLTKPGWYPDDPCACNPACPACKKYCSQDKKCEDTSTELCQNGKCVKKGTDCNTCDTCKPEYPYCQYCQLAPSGKTECWSTGSCTPPGGQPRCKRDASDACENCAIACDSCTQFCKDGECRNKSSDPMKRCEDGRCIPAGDECQMPNPAGMSHSQ